MADISFIPIRGSSNEIANTPRADGQFLYTTDEENGNKVYVDVLREGGTIDRVGILGNFVSKDGDTINGNLTVDGLLDIKDDATFKSEVGDTISLKNIFKAVYPIGSIYMSTNNVNPANLFGGSWVAWGSGKVPVGVDTSDTDFNTSEKTGGQKSHPYTPSGTVSQPTFTGNQYNGSTDGHTLTINEMPSHVHGINGNIVRGGTAIAAHIINTKVGSGTYDVHYKDPTYDDTEYTGSNGNNQSHSHTIKLTPSGTVSRPTFSGSQSTQSHMQPYITCYMWKRIS